MLKSSPKTVFWINQHFTIQMKDDSVFKGKIWSLWIGVGFFFNRWWKYLHKLILKWSPEHFNVLKICKIAGIWELGQGLGGGETLVPDATSNTEMLFLACRGLTLSTVNFLPDTHTRSLSISLSPPPPPLSLSHTHTERCSCPPPKSFLYMIFYFNLTILQLNLKEAIY